MNIEFGYNNIIMFIKKNYQTVYIEGSDSGTDLLAHL